MNLRWKNSSLSNRKYLRWNLCTFMYMNFPNNNQCFIFKHYISQKHLLYSGTTANMKENRALTERRWRKYRKQISERQLRIRRFIGDGMLIRTSELLC